MSKERSVKTSSSCPYQADRALSEPWLSAARCPDGGPMVTGRPIFGVAFNLERGHQPSHTRSPQAERLSATDPRVSALRVGVGFCDCAVARTGARRMRTPCLNAEEPAAGMAIL